jgi:polyhydroxyalkanoate synthase
MTALALAALTARGQAERIGWATTIVTLVDYGEPGDLGIFTDEETIERLERRIEQRGYWDGGEMARTFDFMKGNDLIWSYVVANWYQGKKPPPFDILAWNADATRLPAKMHAEFLRACYLHNLLSKPGAYVIDGTPVDLSKVQTPLFVLSAERDHIAPWRSAYQSTQLFGGEVRHVLTGGGHIAGMVNPPGPKAYLYRRDDTPPDADEWLRGAERVQRSWWEEWVEWVSARSGERVAPPELPAGELAPGRYVLG